MPKVKASMMGKHNPSEEEEAARRWCIDNNIRISPSAVGPSTFRDHPQSRESDCPIVNGPDQLAKNEVWIKMYEYYMYYYKKSNQ